MFFFPTGDQNNLKLPQVLLVDAATVVVVFVIVFLLCFVTYRVKFS